MYACPARAMHDFENSLLRSALSEGLALVTASAGDTDHHNSSCSVYPSMLLLDTPHHHLNIITET